MSNTFPVMLAKSYAANRVDWAHQHVVTEPKLDGVRVTVRALPSGRVTFFSRNGRALEMFRHLSEPLASVGKTLARHFDAPDGVMLDGEMTSGQRFEQIGGAIHRKDHTETDAVLHVFFAMPWKHFMNGRDVVHQLERLWVMDEFNNLWVQHAQVRRLPATEVTTHLDVRFTTLHYLKQGFEGAMVKQLDTPYGNRRSFDWMKVKAERTIDLKVVALQPGRGKYAKTLGAVVVRYKGVEVPVSGMTDEQRQQWWAKPTRIVGKTIEVQYQYVTPKGSLRHPRFKRLRPDKD